MSIAIVPFYRADRHNIAYYAARYEARRGNRPRCTLVCDYHHDRGGKEPFFNVPAFYNWVTFVEQEHLSDGVLHLRPSFSKRGKRSAIVEGSLVIYDPVDIPLRDTSAHLSFCGDYWSFRNVLFSSTISWRIEKGKRFPTFPKSHRMSPDEIRQSITLLASVLRQRRVALNFVSFADSLSCSFKADLPFILSTLFEEFGNAGYQLQEVPWRNIPHFLDPSAELSLTEWILHLVRRP